jgi:hypothetical protein
VKIGEAFGFTTLVFPADLGGVNNQTEPFVLWFDPGLQTDANLRAAHDRWVALLRDAMTNNFHVTITHDMNVVVAVQSG